jgi:NADH-quinone oxidoreductase subunit H
MTISVVGVLMVAGSFQLSHVVAGQAHLWNFMLQPIGAITFMVAAFAETNRLPFDLPEAEPELVAGYHTEYSSMKFAMFMLGEYVNMMTASALIVTLFFGGYHLPWVETLPFFQQHGLWLALLQLATFLAKVCVWLFIFLWVRWSLPRFRYDQLMGLGWRVMLPLALVNLFIYGLWSLKDL